jgi:uncharacterized protein (TIGR00661 family)
MKLSIIVPTYNEEEYLPNLLESIKSQKFKDYEIIIADANSNDRTLEIAKSYGCKIVEGGIPGVGRNNGAKIAKGELLLFLDSDLELTENYLEDILLEFENDKIDIGITLMTPLSEKRRDKLLHDIANWFMVAFEKIKPHGAGCYGIITKKSLHKKNNGFDETLTFGEDTDYIERIAKNNNFKVIKNARICVSTRRLEEEGLIKLTKQYTKSTLNDFIGKRTDAKELEYGFGHSSMDLLDEEDLIKRIDTMRHSETHIISHDYSVSHDSNQKTPNNVSKYFDKNIPIHDNFIEESELDNLNKNENKTESKKKILYSVCGEGMGHAIRSGVIIEELLKSYDVFIFSSDRAYKYLNNKFDNVFEIEGFNTIYEDNQVMNRKTLFNAIKSTPTNLKENYAILYKKAKEFKPNIIISDFENYSSILSKLINVPLISVDNIHMITKTKIDYPPESQREMLKAKGIIKSYIIRPRFYILTSFFYPQIKNIENTVVYPPVIREKIRNLETKYDDYIVVYQTSSNNEDLINALKEIDEKFIVYGFNKKEVDENLTFRRFNEDQIYFDIKNSKAVITNGGFSFITEAIYLKKPIYSIPAKGNFEQLLNGYYVEKLGYGVMTREIDLNKLKNFLLNLEKYQESLKSNKNHDNHGIIQKIIESIEKYAVDRPAYNFIHLNNIKLRNRDIDSN